MRVKISDNALLGFFATVLLPATLLGSLSPVYMWLLPDHVLRNVSAIHMLVAALVLAANLLILARNFWLKEGPSPLPAVFPLALGSCAYWFYPAWYAYVSVFVLGFGLELMLMYLLHFTLKSLKRSSRVDESG